jgi:hypothetical protein
MLRRLDSAHQSAAKLMIFDYIETFYNPRRDTAPWAIARPRSSNTTWLCSQREGCSGGGSLGGETCLTAAGRL